MITNELKKPFTHIIETENEFIFINSKMGNFDLRLFLDDTIKNREYAIYPYGKTYFEYAMNCIKKCNFLQKINVTNLRVFVKK